VTSYELATQADDALLRSLLREHPMESWVTMSMEREPSYFAGMNRFGRDWAVIARDGATSVGMYACSAQDVFVNGASEELGYLGSLRVCSPYRHRLSVVREGYESVRRLARGSAPSMWFTSIATQNAQARRLLEANLKGMPRYQFANELVTLSFSKARGRARSLWKPADLVDLEPMCQFFNEGASEFNFSPVLTPEKAERTRAGFYVIKDQGQVVACMALWNQQAFKQVVARGYRRPLGTLLPVYNAIARSAGRVVLPRVGRALDQSFLAFLAISPSLALDIVPLIEDALALCRTPALTMGLHAEHPWLSKLCRRFRPLRYRTCIYAVSFGESLALDNRPAQPEVALL